MKLIEMFTGYTGKEEIPSGWMAHYISAKFRCACSLFGCGRKDEGYEYLDEAFNLYEKYAYRSDKGILDFGCDEIFGGFTVDTSESEITLSIPDGKGGYKKEICPFLARVYPIEPDLFYYAMTAPQGWEWFNSVRDEEKFKEYVSRAKGFFEG